MDTSADAGRETRQARFGDRRPGARLAARTLAGLFAAGALLALAVLALPHPPMLDEAGIAALAGAALALAAGLRLLPAPTLSVLALLMLLATAMITAALHFAHEASGAFAFFYLWAVLYSAYFFSRRVLAGQVAAIAVGYAVVLTGEAAPLASWALVVGSLVVAAVMVRRLKEGLDGVVGELEVAASIDDLTGLLNRRAFHDRLDAELARARRLGSSVALLVGDLDGFKRVNDLLGHPSGDETLRRAGAIIADASRGYDTAARVGGDEFAIVLPGAGVEGARAVATRAEKALREEFEASPVALTASFGHAIVPADATEADALIAAADRSLYELKRSRARVAA